VSKALLVEVVAYSRHPDCDWALAEYRVITNLAERWNSRTGRCDPSLDTLAADCNMWRRNVVKVLASLERKGYLKRGGPTSGGTGYRRSYQIVIPEPGPQAPVRREPKGGKKVRQRTDEPGPQIPEQGPQIPGTGASGPPNQEVNQEEEPSALPRGPGAARSRSSARGAGRIGRAVPRRKTRAELEAERSRQIAQMDEYMALVRELERSGATPAEIDDAVTRWRSERNAGPQIEDGP
jgi:hypothetical protein